MERLLIVKLFDVPSAKASLARLYSEQWPEWYAAGGLGNASADVEASCQSGDLPLALVALGPEGVLLGGITLKRESLGSEHGLGPWLGALVVKPAWRRQGVGGALIDAGQALARSLGFAQVFATTDAAVGLLRTRDWETTGLHAKSQRGELAIFRKVLE